MSQPYRQDPARFAFIAQRLVTVGFIKHQDLVEAFDIMRQHASRDFELFRRRHPGAMRYHIPTKTYYDLSNVRRAHRRRGDALPRARR